MISGLQFCSRFNNHDIDQGMLPFHISPQFQPKTMIYRNLPSLHETHCTKIQQELMMHGQKRVGSNDISILIIRSKQVGLSAFLLNDHTLLGLQDIIIFFKFAVFLDKLVEFLVHDGVIAGFEDGEVVDSLLHGLDLLLQLLYRLASPSQLLLQLFVLFNHLLSQVFFLLQLVTQVLSLDLIFRYFLTLLLQVLFGVALQLLLHSIPLLLSLLEIFPHIVILLRFLLQFLFNFLFLLSKTLNLSLQLSIPLPEFINLILKVVGLSVIGIPLILSLFLGGLQGQSQFLQFFLELVLLHLSVIVILGEMLIILIDILQLFAQIFDILPHLPYLEPQLLVLRLLSLHLPAQLVALRLQHRNQVVLDLYLSTFSLLTHRPLRLFTDLHLFLLCQVLRLHEFFLQLEVAIEFGKSITFLFRLASEGCLSLIALFTTSPLRVFADYQVAYLTRLLHLFIITISPKFKSKPPQATLLDWDCLIRRAMRKIDNNWDYHLIPNTFSQRLTKPFSSTLSGMPAVSTCSH